MKSNADRGFTTPSHQGGGATSVPPSLLTNIPSKAAGSSPATRSGNNRECDAHTSTLLSPITIKEMR